MRDRFERDAAKWQIVSLSLSSLSHSLADQLVGVAEFTESPVGGGGGMRTGLEILWSSQPLLLLSVLVGAEWLKLSTVVRGASNERSESNKSSLVKPTITD